MPQPRPLGVALERIEQEEDRGPDESDLYRDRQARHHFPHLSPSVAPRESDEYPTYWEEQ